MFKRWRQRKAAKDLADMKIKLVDAIDENINGSLQSIQEISKILIDFKKHKYHKHDSFLNLCIFSDIVEIDLTLLLERIRLAKRATEKNLYARVIALIIVDYLENINVLIGKECLIELKNNNMVDFIDEFKAINKKFSTFRKENEKILRDIRNNTIAHKSKDALKLKVQIDNINPDDIYQFGMTLKLFTREFVDLSTKVLSYIVDYMTTGKRI